MPRLGHPCRGPTLPFGKNILSQLLFPCVSAKVAAHTRMVLLQSSHDLCAMPYHAVPFDTVVESILAWCGTVRLDYHFNVYVRMWKSYEYGVCIFHCMQVIMVTGDHPITAKSIARMVGIFSPGICLSSHRLSSVTLAYVYSYVVHVCTSLM